MTASRGTRPTVAVLIPCYNEGQTIAKVVVDFRAALPSAQIYVYDNNSTDGTAEIARQSGAITRIERQQGKGNVMRTMFREIEADAYVLVDGDDTYPPTAVPEMVRLVIEDSIDMVVGDRLSSTYFTENTRRFHGAGNVLVRRLVNWFFHGDIDDIMTGLRVMSRQFVKSFPVISQGFEIETEMTIHALDKNLAVASMPVEYQDRPAGSESKLNTVADGVRVLRTIFRLSRDYRPLWFFGVVAAIFSAIAVGLLVPVVVDYVHLAAVPRFPSLIVAGFLLLFAALSAAVGLILDTYARTRRQDFERRLVEINAMIRLEALIADRGSTGD